MLRLLVGVGLKGDSKVKFNELMQEAHKLAQQFSNNVMDATQSFEFVLNQEEEVKGCPDFLREALAANADKRGFEGAEASRGACMCWVILRCACAYVRSLLFSAPLQALGLSPWTVPPSTLS